MKGSWWLNWQQLSMPEVAFNSNHSEHWRHGLGFTSTEHLGQLYGIADASTALNMRMVKILRAHCLGSCPNPERCRARSVGRDLNAGLRSFSASVSKLSPWSVVQLVGIGSASQVANEFIGEIIELVMGAATFFGRYDIDCSEPLANPWSMLDLMWAINMYTRRALHKLLYALLNSGTALSTRWSGQAVFDDTSSDCNECNHKAEVLKALLIGRKAPRVAELGVHKGTTSIELLMSSPELRLLGVDPYETYSNRAEAYTLMRKRTGPFHHRFKLVRRTSVNASRLVRDHSLDLVFVDGDHSYEGCLADVLHWAPKLRRGGAMVFDDYFLLWPGVPRCVHDAAARLAAGALHFAFDFVAYFRT